MGHLRRRPKDSEVVMTALIGQDSTDRLDRVTLGSLGIDECHQVRLRGSSSTDEERCRGLQDRPTSSRSLVFSALSCESPSYWPLVTPPSTPSSVLLWRPSDPATQWLPADPQLRFQDVTGCRQRRLIMAVFTHHTDSPILLLRPKLLRHGSILTASKGDGTRPITLHSRACWLRDLAK